MKNHNSLRYTKISLEALGCFFYPCSASLLSPLLFFPPTDLPSSCSHQHCVSCFILSSQVGSFCNKYLSFTLPTDIYIYSILPGWTIYYSYFISLKMGIKLCNNYGLQIVFQTVSKRLKCTQSKLDINIQFFRNTHTPQKNWRKTEEQFCFDSHNN